MLYCLTNVFAKDDRHGVAIVLYIIALLLAVNAIILCNSVRIWLFLRRSVTDLTADSRTRQLSTQLNVVLVVQALTPFALELIPNLLTALFALFGYQISSATAMLSALLNWAPLVNALSIIVIVKPYRRTMLTVTRLGKGDTSTTGHGNIAGTASASGDAVRART